MTRPWSASERFLRGLPADLQARIAPIISPLIRIVPLHPPIAMTGMDAAIFSSANGVRHAPLGQGRTAYCVGQATTQAAHAQGWAAQQCGVDAHSLIQALTRLKPATPLFHLSGRHTRGDIAAHLGRAGLKVQNIAVYDQQPCPLSQAAVDMIARENRVLVPLFSPRTAAQFAKTTPRATSVHAITLSAAVADALGDGWRGGVTIAASPDARAMGVALAGLA